MLIRLDVRRSRRGSAVLLQTVSSGKGLSQLLLHRLLQAIPTVRIAFTNLSPAAPMDSPTNRDAQGINRMSDHLSLDLFQIVVAAGCGIVCVLH